MSAAYYHLTNRWKLEEIILRGLQPRTAGTHESRFAVGGGWTRNDCVYLWSSLTRAERWGREVVVGNSESIVLRVNALGRDQLSPDPEFLPILFEVDEAGVGKEDELAYAIERWLEQSLPEDEPRPCCDLGISEWRELVEELRADDPGLYAQLMEAVIANDGAVIHQGPIAAAELSLKRGGEWIPVIGESHVLPRPALADENARLSLRAGAVDTKRLTG